MHVQLDQKILKGLYCVSMYVVYAKNIDVLSFSEHKGTYSKVDCMPLRVTADNSIY